MPRHGKKGKKHLSRFPAHLIDMEEHNFLAEVLCDALFSVLNGSVDYVLKAFKIQKKSRTS